MQFLTSLFGGSENTFFTAALALAIVLVLILIGLWLLKALFNASATLGPARSRRLNVVDSVAVDTRRRLLIVRRDDVEHLILTGGPQDVVIESNIPAERKSAAVRRPAAPAAAVARPAAETSPANPSRQPGPRAAGPTPLERLRDLGRSSPQHKSASIRHTGLMRPVTRMETAVIPMNPERTENPLPDSATTGPAKDSNGQARLGARGNVRDVFKTEGN